MKDLKEIIKREDISFNKKDTFSNIKNVLDGVDDKFIGNKPNKEANHSLLTKNYKYIEDVLNRNIGEIEYKQEFGDNVGSVSVANVNRPLTTYVNAVRNKFRTYVDYALNLNPELEFFHIYTPIETFNDSILKFGSKQQLLEEFLNRKIAVQAVTFEGDTLGEMLENYTKSLGKGLSTLDDTTDVDTSRAMSNAYDKLAVYGSTYISYVNKLLNESNENGSYQYGLDYSREKIPHQLTKGYSYSSLRTDVNDGISIVNNNAKVNDLVTETFGGWGKMTPVWNLENDQIDFKGNIMLKETSERLSYMGLNKDDNPLILNGKLRKTYGRIFGGNFDKIFGVEKIGAISENDYKEPSDVRVQIDTNKFFSDNERTKHSMVYAEYSKEDTNPITNSSNEGGVGTRTYNSFNDNTKSFDLIYKTNKNFQNGNYKTMISRFSSYDEVVTDVKDTYDIYESAVSNYGLSHGRNLLRKKGNRNYAHKGDLKHTYNDPYCRVWTNYHQYSHVRNQIRPFMEESNDNADYISYSDLYDKYGFNRIRTKETEGFDNGQVRLGEYGVLQHSGYVNITPKSDTTYDTKKCMFSIENLAWKGAWKPNDEVRGLSNEQRGPNGGRIMWFPPYGLTFSESVNTNWSETQFIGRGEKIFSYTDTDRSGTLSFIMLIDHPSILNEFATDNDNNDQFEQDDSNYDILRFFAGCGIPELKSNKPYPQEPQEKEPVEQTQLDPIEVTDEGGPVMEETFVDKKFTCMVFFPNNYSGVKDKVGGGENNKEDLKNQITYGDVDPIVYLLNGIMAQTALKDSDDGKKKEYKDLATNPNVKSYVGTDEIIGYEINAYNTEETKKTITSGVSYYSATQLKDAKNISTQTKATLSGGIKGKLTFETTNILKEYYDVEVVVDESGNTETVQILKTKSKTKQNETIEYLYPEGYGLDDDKCDELCKIPKSSELTFALIKKSFEMTNSGETKYEGENTINVVSGKNITLSAETKIAKEEKKTFKVDINANINKTFKTQLDYDVSVLPYLDVTLNDGKIYGFNEMKPKLSSDNKTIQIEYDKTEYVINDVEINGTSEQIKSGFSLAPITGITKSNENTRWWYRIDADEPTRPYSHPYRNQNIFGGDKPQETKNERYSDRRSFGLNSDSGRETLMKGMKIGKNEYLYGYENEEELKDMYSLLDVYIASSDEPLKSKLKENFEGKYDKERLKQLEDIFAEIKNRMTTVYKIETEGYASKHNDKGAGPSVANLDLANHRAETLAEWARKWDICNDVEAKKLDKIGNENQISIGDSKTDESGLMPKLGRAAKMTVYFTAVETTFKQSNSDKPQYAEINKDEKEPQQKSRAMLLDLDDEPTKAADNEEETKNVPLNVVTIPVNNEAARNGLNQRLEDMRIAMDNDIRANMRTINNTSFFDRNNPKIGPFTLEREIYERKKLEAHEAAKANANGRYDNEYEFFKTIQLNDPLLRTKIVDKVKYFDPAFHSITPEGFNSRLTFLHQCTRQGPTCGNSDFNNDKNASNLAFGRQPICVLRIGDFYNTKIAIKSLNISYELSNGVQWDLNTEGIGVQPMFAKIDINFSFLGGSDIAGPIARLQNAVSFNYYANTGVYDNRSEMVEYGNDGEMIKYKTYNPLNKNNNNIHLTN